jgi:hypothetical protein
LRRLVRRQFDVEVLEQVPEDFRRFDYRCPTFNLMPVMHQLGIQIPAAPYLFAAQVPRKSMIGIAWSGSRNNERERRRSIPLDTFLEMLDLNGRAPHAVQADDLDLAASRNVAVCNFGDFAQTADCLLGMEHIVTIDTAVAHLAGAIGHPSLHIISPYVAYWPWYNPAWYPTAKIYRQPKPGDWSSVFAQVNANLWSGL